MEPKTAAGPDSRRQLLFTEHFLEDLRFWVRSDARVAERLLKLVDLVARDPFQGRGKPEPLKRLEKTWSRRLTEEHRLTYRVTDEYVEYLQARFHYEK
ncbi:MAG TPA: Txe/YoeB family addiction module toxin [Longimicrobium sp.]